MSTCENLLPAAGFSSALLQQLCQAPISAFSSLLAGMQAGAALAARSVLAICVPLFATTRVGQYGTVALASNELMRQLYVGSVTLLASLDISVQALVAAYLGRVDLLLALDLRCLNVPEHDAVRGFVVRPCSYACLMVAC